MKKIPIIQLLASVVLIVGISLLNKLMEETIRSAFLFWLANALVLFLYFLAGAVLGLPRLTKYRDKRVGWRYIAAELFLVGLIPLLYFTPIFPSAIRVYTVLIGQVLAFCAGFFLLDTVRGPENAAKSNPLKGQITD